MALDPRYAARKTREVVYGTAQGTLVLSSKASVLFILQVLHCSQQGSSTPCLCTSAHLAPCAALPARARQACEQRCMPNELPHEQRCMPCALPQGWLGAKETILYGGKGPVHCARMSGTLLAWATSTGIR